MIKHVMDCACDLVSVARGHYVTEEGCGRIYKIGSTVAIRDSLFTVSHTSPGEHHECLNFILVQK